MATLTTKGSCENCSTGFDFFKKILVALICVFIVYGVIYLDTMVNFKTKEYSYIGKSDRMERTITVSGMGKVPGRNDVAMTTIGYSNTDKDVKVAQENNSKVMNPLKAELKSMGIGDKDITDQYTISPNYDYTQVKGQQLRGYQVSNSLAVKIRDLGQIPAVLNLAGKYGANEVGGLSFTIDDQEVLKSEAREKAFNDAKMKARKLANDLGVRLAGVVTYSESSGNDYPLPYGGMTMDFVNVKAPSSISSGSQDIITNVNITYEILP